jgi:hypothetical protein
MVNHLAIYNALRFELDEAEAIQNQAVAARVIR